MKHYSFLILLAACFAMFSCGQSKEFTINATVDYKEDSVDVDGAMAVFNYNGETDTTYVSGNTFSFSGTVDQPEVGIVVVYDKKTMHNMYCYLVVEPGVLTVTISESSTCTGTPLNEANNEYDARVRVLANARREALKAVKNDSTMTDERKAEVSDSIWTEYRKVVTALDSEIFTAHPDDALGANALMSLEESRESFDSLYALAGENVKNARQVVKEKARYETLDKTAVGQMFTDFTIENGTAEGGKVSLSDYVGKGKYVLVDFWASWCRPCKEEIPVIAEVYNQYKGDNFEVVGVAVWDKRADTENILPTLPITWPIIYDAQKVPTDLYGINGIPHIILFGPDGTILARDLRGQEMKDTVAKYLEAK